MYRALENHEKACIEMTKADQSSSRKKDLSSDAKILVVLMKEQPLTNAEIQIKAKISHATFYNTMPQLETWNIVKRVDYKYMIAISGFTDTLFELDAFLQSCIEKHGNFSSQVISLEDLANSVGKPPKDIEKDAYYLAKKYGFEIGPYTRPPLDAIRTSELISRIKRKMKSIVQNLKKTFRKNS